MFPSVKPQEIPEANDGQYSSFCCVAYCVCFILVLAAIGAGIYVYLFPDTLDFVCVERLKQIYPQQNYEYTLSYCGQEGKYCESILK